MIKSLLFFNKTFIIFLSINKVNIFKGVVSIVLCFNLDLAHTASQATTFDMTIHQKFFNVLFATFCFDLDVSENIVEIYSNG